MAKNVSVKKSKRRLKRSVRHSLAAVLMITSIAVAAIPVPENAAAPAYVAPVVDTPDAFQYMYGKSINDTDGKLIEAVQTYQEKFKNIEKQDGNTKLYSSYTVKEKSNGSWEYDWQFKFFRADDGSGSLAAVIDEYNNTYTEKEVELNADIYYEYFQVTPADINQFFSESAITGYTGSITPHGGQEFTISSPNATGAAAAFLKYYFEDDFIEYRDVTYKKYQEEDENWDPSLGGDPPEAPTFTKKVSDMKLLAKKLEYFWEQVGVDLYTNYDAYELVDVIDVPASNSVENVSTYIPRTKNGQRNKDTDKNGFLVKQRSRLIGIGERAFYDIRNVETLIVPEEVRYIGTSAFEKSFIKEITFTGVENISDRAFNECGELHKIDMGNQVKVIGTEAFRKDNGLAEIKFASFVQQIGPGAFSECANLKTVDFSAISGSCSIGEYAFYNTLALEKVNFGAEVNADGAFDPGSTTVGITTLGTGAFAASSTLKTTGFTSFMFPTYVNSSYIANTSEDKLTPQTNKKISGLGDCVLAGRGYLQNVVMPADFGGNSVAARIPDYTFYNCYNLSRVVFPDISGSCGRAWFGQWNGKEGDSYSKTDPVKLFATVTNPNFLVQGPASVTPNSNMKAFPRKSTWKSVSAYTQYVPYLYIEGGKEYYEISDGTYLLCVNGEGYLTSCEFDPDADITDWDHVLVIPATVGNTVVKGIAEGCFRDEDFNNKVWELRIEDEGAITSIDKEVFRGWESLKKVYIGNSITYIGDYAFADCNKLVDVSFGSPTDHTALEFGIDPFVTESPKLTFHGDIVKGYKPFDWAMDPDTLINDEDKLRVCYRSNFPENLTVMYNPNTEMVTLLDYPKYAQMQEILADHYSNDIKAGGYASYEKMMEARIYAQYAEGEYWDTRREAFYNDWTESGGSNDAYTAGNYGPWVNPTWIAGQWTHTGGGAAGGTGDPGAKGQIVDFLFEPIVAYADNIPSAYFDYLGNGYDIYKNIENPDPNIPIAPAEDELRKYIENIVVPDGVDSIDVYGYYRSLKRDGSTGISNSKNVTVYLLPIWNIDSGATEDMYIDLGSSHTDSVRGLFSGYYEDFDGSSSDEINKNGNDIVKSITLNSVQYLPNYAFDSCERLSSVILGPECKEIGTAPFRGCYNLTAVGDNKYYKFQNGIVYSVDEDGSYTIEECLAARGRLVGTALIPDQEDDYISMVSHIRDGAFEDCDYIGTVDLTNTAGLTVIPKDCFKNDPEIKDSKCGQLQTVRLPRTVNEIQAGAFANALKLTEVEIPGKEVFISVDAFEANNDKMTTRISTYNDSSAKRYAETYKTKYSLEYNAKKDQWRVAFYDSNGMMFTALADPDGEPLDNPQYVEEGAKVIQPADPLKEGWTFDGWVGTNNTKIGDLIHADTNFIAQSHSNNGSVDGRFPVAFYDYDGTMLPGTAIDGAAPDGKYYVDIGSTFDKMGYTPPRFPAHDNLANPRWSQNWGTGTEVNEPLIIVVQYSSIPSGGTTNTSGNTTNTSSNTTNNNNNNNTSSKSTSTTSTSNTSSSTSSSSTSTSSTTSDGQSVTMYTLLVQNGSGSGSYAQGATVIISAYPAAEGMVFSNWTTESNGVTLMPGNSSTVATFVMPANNVSITANYVPGTANTAAPVNTVGGTTSPDGNTKVDITKPGISNKDLATANVNGSTDNFIIKISETDLATQSVAAALTNKYGGLDNILYYAMDITLWDSTGTYQLTGEQVAGLSVDITIPIPDALVAYGGNNMAGAVINGNQLENLNESFTTINGVPCIRFRATHFSPYTIYVDTGNLTEGMLDVTPKTGDPIHPKWFLSLGLACLSVILFIKKDKKVKVKTA